MNMRSPALALIDTQLLGPPVRVVADAKSRQCYGKKQ
jgi:hypothetical protein